LAKIIGLPGCFAFVNTIAILVVSAATTNGPSFSSKHSTLASASFCSSDLLIIFGKPQRNPVVGSQCVGDAMACDPNPSQHEQDYENEDNSAY
jgi:hypothetical protein